MDEWLFDARHPFRGIGDMIWSYLPEVKRLSVHGTEKEIYTFLKNVGCYYSRFKTLQPSSNVIRARLSAYKYATYFKFECLKAILSTLCMDCGNVKMAKNAALRNTCTDLCVKCYDEVNGPWLTKKEFIKRTCLDIHDAYDCVVPPRYWAKRDNCIFQCRVEDVDKIINYINIRKKRRLK